MNSWAGWSNLVHKFSYFLSHSFLVFKRLESEFFPRFVKKELRKTFSGNESISDVYLMIGVEGFSLEDSFRDLRLAAQNFSKEDASEINTDTVSDTSSETSEEYSSGTFVISDAVEQPPDSLPSINAQPEDWEMYSHCILWT